MVKVTPEDRALPAWQPGKEGRNFGTPPLWHQRYGLQPEDLVKLNGELRKTQAHVRAVYNSMPSRPQAWSDLKANVGAAQSTWDDQVDQTDRAIGQMRAELGGSAVQRRRYAGLLKKLENGA